jgi:hypothetical protein
MPDDQTNQRMSDDEFDRFLTKVMYAVGGAAWLVVVAYFLKFRGRPLSSSPEDWGTFGDYIGGLLNPIVGLATVALVIFSITIQRREMRTTVLEMKAANESTNRIGFEQALFAWLENYRSLVHEIRDDEGNSGRAVLTSWYESSLTFPAMYCATEGRFVDTFGSLAAAIWKDNEEGRTQEETNIKLHEMLQCGLDAYQRLYEAHRSELDAMLRTLYRLIRWVDQSTLTPTQKWHYVALVRAQISWVEMVFLLFNSLGKNGRKFAALINEYAFFDNLETDSNVVLKTVENQFSVRGVPRNAEDDMDEIFPLNASAFSSALAKLALGIPAES